MSKVKIVGTPAWTTTIGSGDFRSDLMLFNGENPRITKDEIKK